MPTTNCLGPPPGALPLDSAKVLTNPFYLEISSLYQELETDQLVAGDAVFASGRNLIVSANAQALAPYASNGQSRTLVLSASEKLSFEGDLTWSDKPENAARLVAMSAGEMTFAKGMTLKSATSDLVIASQKNIVMDGVSLNASQEAAIRGMRDISLDNAGIGCRLHGHDQGGTELERRWIDLQSLRIKHTYGGHYHQG